MRALATTGFVLLALMQLIFLATGSDRPFPYSEVQVLSLMGTLALVWGAWSGTSLALAVGFGVNLVTRVLQPVLGVTRLPAWATALLVVGWAWAFLATLRGRDPRGGVWVLAAAHFLAALVSFGRLTAAIALCLGAIGLFLAAPNLMARPSPAPAPAPPP
ncbi:MAG TPA: hypothetical protein VFH78_07195 [Candidatus Thermoplasmatota archaeon]|nr:hypothetical protein [Candidatus Thermoplasmatota archaeon]